ncbi:MAG: HTH-type transcriptional activator RhaS [Verrucomicrobiae bacterium]|nr:HTH-type transcriptional activator RhaS [Verrucomicrobiae bacterium]
MLQHLAAGMRHFGKFPMYIHRRTNWEFFAVVRGRCGYLMPETTAPVLKERRLWVFAPETAHGWAGQGAQSCSVAIFHFGTVPPLLEKIVRRQGWLEHALTPTQARQVTQLERSLRPHYQCMNELSGLLFERALLELTLLVLEGQEFARAEPRRETALRKVEAVMLWYNEHMAEQPKLELVAAAAHVSVRHLRRLFEQTRHETPQEAFTKLRLQRAMELLAASGDKLDVIAGNCGFSSASDFCRVFKANHPVSPDTWRREKLPVYREPKD